LGLYKSSYSLSFFVSNIASIGQYSCGTNFCISFSLSANILNVALWTLPAETPPVACFVINDTFHFLSDSNLGTLKITEKFEEDKDKPDLIITNPPYITSGVTTIRKQIEEDGLTDYYKNSGKGMEGLCLKWIIKNLKRKGQAFVVLPDSIF